MSMPSVVPKARHTATVIFLHGLGDTGHGWCQAFEEIAEPFVKYLFPTAKTQPVTLNFGMKMPSWFDIKSLSFQADEDTAGIKQSSNFLRSLVQEEIKNGISPDRIIIGGFSQGGAVALHAAFTSDVTFGGVVALSTWLPMHQQFPAASTGKNQSTPIFQGHGDHDPVVPYQFGKMTHEYLKKMNPSPVFKTYRGVSHSSCEQEMGDVKDFIRKCFT
ncbi:acyl-protein thioesterase 1-like [Rhopilema esculentum]|uniref:acyl-protein thioesterase 1-like n=1 Tax=Rhopilema esculentum TaxID=499914 RepID=UPI0031DDD61D